MNDSNTKIMKLYAKSLHLLMNVSIYKVTTYTSHAHLFSKQSKSKKEKKMIQHLKTLYAVGSKLFM